MKIIIVLLTHIDNLPPARSLLISLSKIDCQIELITMYSFALPDTIKQAKNITVHDVQSKVAKNKIVALSNRFILRAKVRTLIKRIASPNDVLWTVTDYDAMEVGDLQLRYRHITQLMELIKDIPVFDEFPPLKADIAKYAKSAQLVVVPEYNRAHIQKAYWQLDKLPVVLPNKPTISTRNFDIQNISQDACQVLNEIGDRKIVLYQGVFGYERVLDQFIEAVEMLGDEYCMLLMGRNDTELQKLLKKYPKTFFIPFISAPDHLAVTQKAHIGVLSYVNTNNIRHYDPLNALYCAPNKLYEYACFGVPMIGNDIPGLDIPFSLYGIGKTSELKAERIVQAIRDVESDYTHFSKNCVDFYRDIDFDEIVISIVHKLEETAEKVNQ